MPKKLIVTALGNEIEYATVDKGGNWITGEREVVTENAIAAVATHYKNRFDRENPDGKGIGRDFGKLGKLMWLAPGTKVVWMEED